MKTRRLLLVAVAAIAVLTAACGGDDDNTSRGTDDAEVRTVQVEMVDIAFKPNTLQVRRGETVRFVFNNTGKVAHDAFVGDAGTHRAERDTRRRRRRSSH